MQTQIGRVHQQRLRLYFHHLLLLLLLQVVLLLLLLLVKLLLFFAGRRRRGGRGRSDGPTFSGAIFLPQHVLLLESAPPSQVGAVVEHVVRVGIERPVGSLARLLVVARHFDETFVKRQIVANRVLPSLFVLPVVREPVHNELVDPVECNLLLRGRALDGHRDQRDVRIRRFHHVLDARVVRHGRTATAPAASANRAGTARRVGRTGVRVVAAHGRRVVVTVAVTCCDVTGGCGGCSRRRGRLIVAGRLVSGRRSHRQDGRRRLMRRRAAVLLLNPNGDCGCSGRSSRCCRCVMVSVVSVVMMMALVVIEERVVIVHVGGGRRGGRGRRSGRRHRRGR